MSAYEGDVLLQSTLDGGEINFTDGIIEMTTGFETMVYLLLFGGNIADDGTTATEKKEWWGNKLEENNSDRKIHSRTQNLIHGLPATPENLLLLEEAARQDLSILISEKIVDKIEMYFSIPSKNRVNMVIIGWKDENKLFETEFEENWKGMAA